MHGSCGGDVLATRAVFDTKFNSLFYALLAADMLY
jgi:hypothetical protein